MTAMIYGYLLIGFAGRAAGVASDRYHHGK